MARCHGRGGAVGVDARAAVARLEQAVADQAPAAPGESLETVESRLADRYDRLELLAARLAELSGGAQPRRAELLRKLIAQGRERDVPGQFDEVVEALGDGSYSTAVEGQARLQADLEKLLELLLQEDRDRQLEAERKRILRYHPGPQQADSPAARREGPHRRRRRRGRACRGPGPRGRGSREAPSRHRRA